MRRLGLGLGLVPTLDAATEALQAPDVYNLNTTSPTFTRATSSWDPRLNKITGAGVRRTKPVTIGTVTYNADLIEGARTNLLAAGTSESLDRWSAFTRASATANATTAPDGSLTADKLVEDGTAANSHFAQANFTAVDTSVYSLSVYAMAGERTWLWMQMADTASSGRFFNLSTGVMGAANPSNLGAGTLTGASITSVGGGWYRCTITKAAGGTAPLLRCGIGEGDNDATYSGDATSGIYLWGAVAELGAFPSTYISNRNLLLRTEEFDNAGWTKTRSSVSANSIANPIDGSVTADTLIDTTDANTQHYLSQAVTKAASSLTYTFSAYGRRKERDIVLRVTDTGFTNGARAHFNLATGAMLLADTFGAGWTIVGTPSAASVIAPDGSQWYRCQITVTSDTSTTIRSAIELIEAGIADDTYTGDGTSGAYIYGAQLEYGTTATTYWAVQGTVGARSADDLKSTVTMGTAAGSLFIVAESHGWSADQDGSTTWALCGNADGGNTFATTSRRAGSNLLAFQRRGGGVDNFTGNGAASIVSGTRFTTAGTWDATAVRQYIAGAESGTADTSLTTPYDATTVLQIGGRTTSLTFHGYVLALYKHGVAWGSGVISALHAGTSRSN
jgi:hypothetical protein